MRNAKATHGTHQQGHRPRYGSSSAGTRSVSSQRARTHSQRAQEDLDARKKSSPGGAPTKVLLILALIIILVSAIGLGTHRIRTHRQPFNTGAEEVSSRLVEENDLKGTMALIDRTIMEKGEAEFLGASQEQLVSSYYLPCSISKASEEVGKVFESRGWKDLGFGESEEMAIFGQSTQEPDEPDRAVVMFIEEDEGCTVVIEFLKWGSAS